MSNAEAHIDLLFTAELQFRLATAVELAVTGERQPLDLPVWWTHGEHAVGYEEIALRQDQAEYATFALYNSATYLMAVAMKDAIRAVVPDPKSSTDSNVQAAYQVSRLVRNAFAHAPFAPVWSIDPDCRNKIFEIPGLIRLDTAALHGKQFDWRHYGGPLALFRLCRFVRFDILKDQRKERQVIPFPKRILYRQGDLVIEAVDEIPADARHIEVERRPDGGLDLGGGHVLYPQPNDEP